ncbi:MAG: toll/interleukin-1 receptor domain-containing protein [Candidatus Fibromonas sp.]|jgi:hypothetical protein|nr:toll/interleukin-1 receptor domain-containing protein [Candidatus Fibromonas sp.]
MPNFNIFISYRRKGGFDTAKLIYDRLRMDGYSVSFDIATLENGNFDNELEKRVKKCKDFIIILNPGIFDCFSEEGYDAKDDWVRREISFAIKANKNIIPLLLDDFAYPRRLPSDIKDLSRKNGIDINPKLFETSYEKLKENFLHSKAHWKIRHKKHIRYFIATLVSVFVLYLAYFLYTGFYREKDLEAKEWKAVAQKADSIRVAREVEFVRSMDSLKIAIGVEMIYSIDSMKNKIERLEYLVDSLKKAQKSASQKPAPAVQKPAAAAQKPATTQKSTASNAAKQRSKSEKKTSTTRSTR